MADIEDDNTVIKAQYVKHPLIVSTDVNAFFIVFFRSAYNYFTKHISSTVKEELQRQNKELSIANISGLVSQKVNTLFM